MSSNVNHIVATRNRGSFSWYHTLWLILLAAAVYAITFLPYLSGYINTPEGTAFSGTFKYIQDQNAYLSFIRQAADGHILFVNRMTHMQHESAFFNLQWLIVGRIMSLFNISIHWAFEIWRVMATFTLLFGFSMLASEVLQNKIQRIVAVLMCAVGGGFGWFFLYLKQFTLFPWPQGFFRWGTFDLRFIFHPFLQMLFNPNSALPLGLLCIFFAFYIKGEKSGEARWYWIAGIAALVDGTMRPYDLIAISCIIPLFIAIDIIPKRKISFHLVLRRMIPVIMFTPLFLYYSYLFYLHPVYKYWGSQGLVPRRLPLYWHILNTGFSGILCTVRLCLAKKYPLAVQERLMLAWALCIMILSHAYKFFDIIPYSLQIASSLMPPLILLGVTVLEPGSAPRKQRWPAIGLVFLAIFLVVNSISSAILIDRNFDMVKWSSRLSSVPVPEPEIAYGIYIPTSEMEAYAWLDQNGSESEVVLSTRSTGNYLMKYASVRVVTGHWDITPLVKSITQEVNSFFRGEMTLPESREFIEKLGIDWLYTGQIERSLTNGQLHITSVLKRCFDNGEVEIYATAKKGNCEVSDD